MRRRFLDFQLFRRSSEHHQIARSALLVAAFVLFAKVIAAGKEMAVAWQYGVGDIVDAYQIASTVMLWLPTTLGAALTTVLIPLFLSSKASYSDRKVFAAELQGWSVLVGLLLAASACMLLPLLLDKFWSPDISVARREYIQQFSTSFLIPAIVTLPIIVYSALLMAMRQQWNTLLEGVPALCILVAIAIFHSDNGDVRPMYWGTLLGYLLQAAFLYLILHRNHAAPAGFRIKLRSAQWLDIRNLLGLLLLSQFFLSWAAPIDMATAMRLGEGAVAQLSYAERLLSLILGIGSIAISRAVLPVFSEVAAQNQWHKLLDLAIKWGAVMFLIGGLICAVAWVLAPWGIQLLYQRGAFTAADTAAVADVFALGLTRVPFYFAGVVFFQLLASQHKFAWAAAIMLFCISIKYPLNDYLSARLGVGGINLSTGIMYLSSALLQLLVGVVTVRRRLS